MRDPARIPRMLALLAEVWAEYPDQRLGQLIDNAPRHSARYQPNTVTFNVEDDRMESGLRGMLIYAKARDRARWEADDEAEAKAQARAAEDPE